MSEHISGLIARAGASRSNGIIILYSEPDEGTAIRIFLPRGQGTEESEANTVVEEEIPHGSETVLVVDDEDDLAEIAVANLEALGYKTLMAQDGKTALKIIKDNPGIDLLFSDVIMPGDLDGYQLAIAPILGVHQFRARPDSCLWNPAFEGLLTGSRHSIIDGERRLPTYSVEKLEKVEGLFFCRKPKHSKLLTEPGMSVHQLP